MTPRHVALLALLAGIWGASYLLIKVAIEDLPAPLVVAGRTGLAAAVLLLVVRAQGGAALEGARAILRRPWHALALGFVSIAAPFLLITYGELTVPSGLTAVLISSAPIFVALMAPLLDVSEVLGPVQWLGLGIGLAGVALLVGADLVGTTGELLGALAMIGAAVFYGLAGYLVKRWYSGVPPVVPSLASVAAAALLVLPVAAVDRPTEVPGAGALLAVAALGVAGTAYAFVIFYRLMAEVGVGRASLVAYLIPGVALVYGALLLDEAVTWSTVAGFGLILGGTVLAARRRARPEAAPAP